MSKQHQLQTQNKGGLIKWMKVSISPSLCVSEFMCYLKGKSILMMFERYTNLKYGRRAFCTKGGYIVQLEQIKLQFKNILEIKKTKT